jgi:hypothetical protein
MRTFLGSVAMLAMVLLAWGADQTPPPQNPAPPQPAVKKPGVKRPVAKTGTSKTGTAAKKSATTPGKKPATTTTASARGGKKAPPKRTTWRNRQLTPTPERYHEIQDALVAKGYLKSEEANGTWGPSSADALKRFQTEQNIEASGKINSLSLIALGLGPKHDTTAAVQPPKPPQQ